jgi:hypothetical protein
MTNLPAGPTPPGWYPDPAGTQAQRWWDGIAWTENVRDIAAPQGAAPYSVVSYAIPKAPEGTSPFTPWIWIIAFTPILRFIDLILQGPETYKSSLGPDASAQEILAETFTPAYFLDVALGLLFYGLVVVFAYLDWRALKDRGVQRPFHWAFAFIPWQIVYVIGRAVVVARRTGSGYSPMVVYIVLWLGMIAIFAVIGAASAVAEFNQIN